MIDIVLSKKKGVFMKNTNKFLSAIVALVIALCSSVQISAMYGEVAQYRKNEVTRLEQELQKLQNPKIRGFNSEEHQKLIEEIKELIAENKAEYNKLTGKNYY